MWKLHKSANKTVAEPHSFTPCDSHSSLIVMHWFVHKLACAYAYDGAHTNAHTRSQTHTLGWCTHTCWIDHTHARTHTYTHIQIHTVCGTPTLTCTHIHTHTVCVAHCVWHTHSHSHAQELKQVLEVARLDPQPVQWWKREKGWRECAFRDKGSRI